MLSTFLTNSLAKITLRPSHWLLDLEDTQRYLSITPHQYLSSDFIQIKKACLDRSCLRASVEVMWVEANSEKWFHFLASFFEFWDFLYRPEGMFSLGPYYTPNLRKFCGGTGNFSSPSLSAVRFLRRSWAIRYPERGNQCLGADGSMISMTRGRCSRPSAFTTWQVDIYQSFADIYFMPS